MDTTPAAAPAADELHAPHDRIGKPIAVGAAVTVWGQGRGTVASITADGQVNVDRDNGSSVTAAPGDLIVLAPPSEPAPDAADGAASAPTGPDAAKPADTTGGPPAADTPPVEAAPAATPPDEPAATPPTDGQPAADVPADGEPPAAAATEPAPDATPDGAFSWLIDDAGATSAWLRTDEGDDPVGYLQTDASDPSTTVRYVNASEWADEVDRLGLHEPDEGASPEISPEAAATAAAASAAPPPHAAPPGAEGKAPVTSGTFVTYTHQPNVVGRVDLVVTSGTLPGTTIELKGTTADPVARVTIWEPDGDGYKPTEVKTAVPVAQLVPRPPLPATKAANTAAALVLAAAEHEQQITEGTLPAHAKVSAVSTKAAYERGMRSWPGESATTLTRAQWALGRAKTLLAVAAGETVEGFTDTDLLAKHHPLAANATPAGLTVTAADLDATLAGLEP
jgi:hypothetical protein